MHSISRSAIIGTLALAVLTAGGCREGENQRPLSFEPGVYKGEKSRALTEAEQKALLQRGNLQK